MSAHNKTRSFLIALIIIAGLIFLNFPLISKRVKNFFYSVSIPLSKQIDSAANQVEGSWNFLNSLKTISKQNIKLKEQIQQLKAQNTKLQEFKEENKMLRSYLELNENKAHTLELADVINQDFQGLEQFILINKGRLGGIEKNMPVVALNNVLVGRVVEVFKNFSKVLLISSSNIRVPSLIQELRVSGIIKGGEKDKLIFDMVPKNIHLEKGQTVISSNIGENIPKGLLIGEIFYIEKKEDKIFQYIEVMPAVNFKQLEQVFIIKK